MESGASLDSVNGVVQEIMRMHRSLPQRPGVDEVSAAKDLIKNLEEEEKLRLDNISKQQPQGQDVPQELFGILTEMQNRLALFQSRELKRESLRLEELENVHQLFDEMIQRASKCVAPSEAGTSGSVEYDCSKDSNPSMQNVGSSNFGSTSGSASSSSGVFSTSGKAKSSELFTRDDSYVPKAKDKLYDGGIRIGSNVGFDKPQILDSTLKPSINAGQGDDKMSYIKIASLIEASSKEGITELNLQNKLLDQVERLPDSIGKLSALTTLDLSENHIAVLPTTIGNLGLLTKLNLHSNRISAFPEAICNLSNLAILDLRTNQLTSLPANIGKLVNLEVLDLSINSLHQLPLSIGHLTKLKKLIVDNNNLEEFPFTIGYCASLQELRANYNNLKALPEAIGRIVTLEVLSVRHNIIKQLPTTMSSLTCLRELDVSSNHLESVPENLCFATALVKINFAENFANMKSLPGSIGNLENLEELDISHNQISLLPDSFRMLKSLEVLRAEGNPLEVPPRHVAEQGAQAVVQFMADFVANKDVKEKKVKLILKNLLKCLTTKTNE